MREINEIYQEMCADFASRAGFAPNDGCDAAVRLYALAAQVQALEIRTEWALAQMFPQTAQGTYLDEHALLRGLQRREAGKAAGVIRFFAEAGEEARVIPAGTVCLNDDGVRFATAEDAHLAAGEETAEAAAYAVEAGETGNAAAGRITHLAALPAGVTGCTNPGAFTGGCAAEDDDSLRERVLASYRELPNGANAAFYEQQARTIPGIAAAKAVGRSRGVGTVDVYVTASDGAASAALRAETAAKLNAVREIAADVQVLSPQITPIAVTAELAVEPGYSFDEVAERAEAALRAELSGEKLGKSVPAARLNALLFGLPGVQNCHLLAPTQDHHAEETELLTLGTLSLCEMEDE